MRIRSIVLVLSGAALGVALVISCGHSPSTADAADQCTCPAAEPPIGGRIVQTTAQGTAQAQGIVDLSPQCPAGATLLGGGCRLDTLATELTLSEDGPLVATDGAANPGWNCTWKNPTASAVNATAIAICLKPAQ